MTSDMKSKRLYRPPDGPGVCDDPRHVSAYLTMRLLAFLFKLKMKEQAGIKTSDISFYVDRMNAKTK